ncbi:hypothetical protein [Amycolatopsis sp. lyj-90]|uniref:hypothetical protein n=1 Tax=Amycolatopsis sp. lyj-90 TaxID=2789285 RepID=UPI00397E73D9
MRHQDDKNLSSVEYQIPIERLDEWLRFLYQMIGAAGYEINSVDEEVGLFESRVRGSESSTVLQIQKGNSDFAKIKIIELANESHLETYTTAIATATARLSQPAKTLPWSAIIGPDPENSTYTSPKIAEPARLAEIDLLPSTDRLLEWVQVYPKVHDRELSVTWPARAFGHVTGTDHRKARRDAALKVRRICSLLSVISRDCWIVRQGPEVGEYASEMRFPVTDPEIMRSDSNLGPFGESPRLEVPEWLSESINRLDEDVKLSDALTAFHEALLLQKRHPSIALVALVTAIEAIGSRTVSLTSCKTCEHCTEEFGYARRFRKTLARVLHKKEISHIGDAYNYRSRTAHDGTLFGTDRFPGTVMITSILSSDKEGDFDPIVNVLRRACRRLLILELGGPETWTRSADDLPRGLVAATVTLGQQDPQRSEQIDAPAIESGSHQPEGENYE